LQVNNFSTFGQPEVAGFCISPAVARCPTVLTPI
jgi:hypothetical protein